ncbi:unnamed protein product [Ostreobium quekettii]|uniref:Uncharacterized protein n=1 Tax=Ostreobium quekettii TaxID=121088 RepID=A0A8S1ISK3_9CHLO|nr:unnamed protein product [Ostreobium quekettii]|eukprot:evm.model.scf_554.4 EVM.evm.TU.scf_554.4   scf_554:67434-70658(+)
MRPRIPVGPHSREPQVLLRAGGIGGRPHWSRVGPARSASGSAFGTAAGSDGGGSMSPSASSAPWMLMGRVVGEASVPLGNDGVMALRLRDARAKLGLSEEGLAGRIEALLNLIPDLQSRVERLPQDILCGLLQDLEGTASKMVILTRLLPDANISLIVAQCPHLLFDSTFKGLPDQLDRLQTCLSLDKVSMGSMLEQNPRLLLCDVEAVMEDLVRLMPNHDPAQVLQQNPSMLFAAERGPAALGPGAEFVQE